MTRRIIHCLAMLALGLMAVPAHAWPISVGTVRRYAAGEDPAEALREAMLEVMNGKQVPGGEHPLLWAPFVFVGR